MQKTKDCTARSPPTTGCQLRWSFKVNIFLLHLWPPSCYSLWIPCESLDYEYDTRNIFVVISVTVMVTIDNLSKWWPLPLVVFMNITEQSLTWCLAAIVWLVDWLITNQPIKQSTNRSINFKVDITEASE